MLMEHNKCTHWFILSPIDVCQTFSLYRQEANLKRNHGGLILIHLNHACTFPWHCVRLLLHFVMIKKDLKHKIHIVFKYAR